MEEINMVGSFSFGNFKESELLGPMFSGFCNSKRMLIKESTTLNSKGQRIFVFLKVYLN